MASYLILITVNSSISGGNPSYQIFRDGAFISNSTTPIEMSVYTMDIVIFMAIDSHSMGANKNTVSITAIPLDCGAEVFNPLLQPMVGCQNIFAGSISASALGQNGTYGITGYMQQDPNNPWTIDPKITIIAP